MSELLYLAIFVVGACLGGQLNRGIYRLAWHRRDIGPWSAARRDAPPRRGTDRLPIVGWWGLRRETPLHGRLFWLRPLLIEIASGAGLVWLYSWEVQRAGLLPPAVPPPHDAWLLHVQFLTHAALFALLLLATFIDFDEKTIPDSITLPGTVGGLALLAACPAAALPIARTGGPGPVGVGPLLLTSPGDWAASLDGSHGLLLGLACLAGWCLAVWPKTTTLRRGPVKAVQFCVVSMFRFPLWWLFPLLFAVGATAIAAVWAAGGERWAVLLSALAGLGFGGGMIWSIRLVGGGVLGKEAMGFGDVTLMAMIGVFVGWQTTLIIFSLAPFVAVFLSLAQWLLTRRRDIAFGPFLCVAALLVVLDWSNIWERQASGIFAMGWLVPQLLFCCLLLLAGMLGFWRIVERAFGGERR